MWARDIESQNNFQWNLNTDIASLHKKINLKISSGKLRFRLPYVKPSQYYEPRNGRSKFFVISICLWLLVETGLRAGTILCVRPANVKPCYVAASSLIEWAHNKMFPVLIQETSLDWCCTCWYIRNMIKLRTIETDRDKWRISSSL